MYAAKIHEFVVKPMHTLSVMYRIISSHAGAVHGRVNRPLHCVGQVVMGRKVGEEANEGCAAPPKVQ